MNISKDIPINFHNIERVSLKNTSICAETYMEEYAGNGRVQSFYKANSNIAIIYRNEDK